jgi:hypothetical protein
LDGAIETVEVCPRLLALVFEAMKDVVDAHQGDLFGSVFGWHKGNLSRRLSSWLCRAGPPKV